ncbi:MAG: homoserine dehydrogenase, partial [Mesorhizobium sp.]
DIDVFVELIGGDEGPARASVKAALEAGRHVVTANKALLAKHGVQLAEIAEKKGVLLNYEAAVAGGIPVIKTMREAMAGNSVTRVFGILNGTCNYILTRMEAEGISFDAVLKDAQRLGYAEADP